MIILVDQDGVLANFEYGFLRRWRYLFPNDFFLPLDQRKNFHIEDDYPDYLEGEIVKIFSEPGFFAGLEPIPGGAKALRAILRLGHEVFICTSPFKQNRGCAAEKLAWVEKNIGGDFLKRVIITEDKTLVRGDILIDDKPKVKGLVKPAWEHILFTQPYNAGEKDKRRLDWTTWRKVLDI